MSRASGISKFISKLLPPGEYARAAQKAATVESDADRLVRLSKKYGRGVAEYRENLRKILEDRYKAKSSPENLKLLNEFKKEFYGIEPANIAEEAPKAKIIPGRRKPTQEKELDAFQETLETRVKENPTPENIEVLDNFRKKREAKEYPDLSQALKAAGLAGAIGAGSSLMPEEAEAGFPGSVLARKGVLKQTEKAMDAWTSGPGGRELREKLQNQLDLDPTGTAKKEALRRLAARTEVRQNPVTGEHEFKVYRGDVKDRAGEAAQSYTTNPDVAQEFADAYGGQVRETWLPASRVGSIPSIMKEGQYLSSEGEIIAKPFKAESALYTPKEPSLHQRISARGASKEAPEEVDDLISEMISEAPASKKKAAKAAGIAAVAGLGGMTAREAKAAEVAKRALGNPEEDKKMIAESLNTAAGFISPFSRIGQLVESMIESPPGAEDADKPKNKQLTPEQLAALYK